MKKMLLIAAGVAASVVFSGCASTGAAPAQSPAQVLATVHADVSKACVVAQSSMASVWAMESQMPTDQQAVVDQINKGVNDFCAMHDTVSVASVQAFASSAIPAAIKLVGSSSLDQSKKIDIQISLIAFQAALSSALVQFAPALAPVAASSAQ